MKSEETAWHDTSSCSSSDDNDDDDDDYVDVFEGKHNANHRSKPVLRLQRFSNSPTKGSKKRITAIDGKKNNFDSDNDSDDTAELLRNLPKKSPPAKDDNMNMTSSSSPPLVRCFSPKKLSRNNNDITISSLLASNNGLCADSVEAAVDDDDDDKSSVDNMMERTRQLPIERGCHKLERSNNDIVNGIPCSSKDNYSQQKPKGTLSQCSLKDCYTSSEEHTSNKQSPHDDTPIQFRLPPQSSSSEESGSDDDNDTDEDRGDEEKEKKEEEMDSNTEHISQTNDFIEGSYLNSEIRNPYAKTTTTTHHSRRMTNNTRDSFGGTITNGNLLSTDDFTIAKQNSNTQNQHRSYQQHQEGLLHTKSNEELFHESFLDGEINNDIVNTRRKDDVPSHQSGINNNNTSEPQYNKYRENEQPQQRIDQYNRIEPFEVAFVDHHASSSSTNAASSDFRHPPPQESSDQRCDDARTNKESFGELFLDGHPPPTSQDDIIKHTNDMQQPPPQEYIDLVNSDSEGENQHNRHNNHQEHTSARVFHDSTDASSSAQWGRQSPASSPKFNIAARGFIHNKPRATFTDNPNSTKRSDNHRSHDDDIYFEKNDRASMLPAPRRVTQYHANQLRRQEFQQQQHQQSNPIQQHTAAIGSIPRPWPPSVGRTTRRLRDATASNVSLAANVVSNKNRNLTSRLPTPSTTSVIQPSLLQRRNNTINTNTNNNGDIRNFVSRRPRLVDETRMRSMENVRSSRHDIQGHANVTMMKNPPPAAKRRSQQEEEDDDVIEVYKDETAPPAPARRARTRTRTTTTTRPKPKVKTKRKRATSRKAKPRKGGRKRTASTRGKGRGGNKFGRRGGAAGGGGDATSGAWGPTGGGWASAPPVHREDPAFQNVGAEISF
ncbi:hypothetical protein FRACYDRAFT_257279 [Fragilariopsis cylindrus CCMP1102]|uniref:Uncharacterized protein n=1 Tax=Fragilariopsis cylindrus CCMP1102 TaxID=635003 RepID=A0A1E7EJ76_9STRA|nr:hypothetical protein FRACYDRAFT_257279 [Fragilariopsis cylindrus CCMP1102]|eukprot:OEU05951.1 hypothetical protein FRACYDRAFT_257279 [Fragilariopsis cylindrus CCMP1102]